MRKKKRNNLNQSNRNSATKKKKSFASYVLAAWGSFKSSLFWKIGAAIFGLAVFAYPFAKDYVSGVWGGKLALSMHSERLIQDTTTFIFYAIPPDSDGRVFLVPVQLSIINDSNTLQNDATLSIRYEKSNKRPVITEDVMRASGIRTKSDVVHELNSDDNYDYSNYRVAFLPPGDKASFTDGAFSAPFELDTRFPVLMATNDGLDIQVTTYSESDSRRRWDIHYRGVRVGDDKGLEWWVRRFYGTQVAIELRKSSGFWRYFYGWITSKEIVVYGFSPSFQHVPNSEIYMPLTFPKKYEGFKFSPYVGNLLFDFD